MKQKEYRFTAIVGLKTGREIISMVELPHGRFGVSDEVEVVITLKARAVNGCISRDKPDFTPCSSCGENWGSPACNQKMICGNRFEITRMEKQGR